MDAELMGPPEKGPIVKVFGKGISLSLCLEDKIDSVILDLALQMAERRRYGRSGRRNR